MLARLITMTLIAASGARAAGIPEAQFHAMFPSSGAIPPNAVVIAETGGTFFSAYQMTIQIDGNDVVVPVESSTCNDDLGGSFTCAMLIPLPSLTAGGAATVAMGTTENAPTVFGTFTVLETADSIAPTISGNVTGTARYVPFFYTGTNCNKSAGGHYIVELDVPFASDDTGVVGYGVSVDRPDESAVDFYRPLRLIDGIPRVVFNPSNPDDNLDCYFVRALDLSGHLSDPLEPFCVDLSTLEPEPAPTYCEAEGVRAEPEGCSSTRASSTLVLALIALGLHVTAPSRRRRP
jgi:hypothetical protein